MRDPYLSKSDPLIPVHIKIPSSVKSALDKVAIRRQRFTAYLIREILQNWEQETRLKREQEEETAPAGKRRRVG